MRSREPLRRVGRRASVASKVLRKARLAAVRRLQTAKADARLTAAAVTVQRKYRVVRARQLRFKARDFVKERLRRDRNKRRKAAATRIQKNYRGHALRAKFAFLMLTPKALRIQRWFRRHRGWRLLHSVVARFRGATGLAALWRGHAARRAVAPALTAHRRICAAARAICAVGRAFMDRRLLPRRREATRVRAEHRAAGRCRVDTTTAYHIHCVMLRGVGVALPRTAFPYPRGGAPVLRRLQGSGSDATGRLSPSRGGGPVLRLQGAGSDARGRPSPSRAGAATRGAGAAQPAAQRRPSAAWVREHEDVHRLYLEAAGGAKGMDGVKFSKLLRAAGVCSGAGGIQPERIDVAFTKARQVIAPPLLRPPAPSRMRET